MKILYWFLLFFPILHSCSKDQEEKKPPTTIEVPIPKSQLLQVDGTTIVDANGNKVLLKGVAFGNNIWDNASTPSTTHHNEADYERVKNMGMNTIRFYMNYSYFEDDTNPYTYKSSGWSWLDQNIAWAKKHGIYLILNMHAPQGGYQSQGNGDALWAVEENQNRLIALWKAIADRYKDEVQIAGFGPVNEPVPTIAIAQWSALAQKLIDGIREVDENHLIFVENAIYVKDNYEFDENLNFPQINGTNLIYEFHSYDPHAYTHQMFDWAGLDDGGKYPDESRIEVASGEWYTAIFDNDNLNSGTSDWTYFEGVKYTVSDPNISYAVPALIGQGVGGTVFFDDVVIKEYDETGAFVRDINTFDFNKANGWYYWSANASGEGGFSSTIGNTDTSSIYISAATGDCNMSGAAYTFIPQQGYQYQISGYMKGDNVSDQASCKLRLDFHHTDSAILKRNKEYLAWSIGRYTAWANAKNVPLYIGEFGAGRHCFENNKGGLQFVEDMLDVILDNEIHFTYHSYHEDSFGLYFGYGELPSTSNANTDLIDLFTRRLN
ncbi:glycoside hydrolase family 5 protein [Maribacter luteus]|uniref:glycoside hydrolase family 5 protein n=1 Tax=Maribacter luteus TaxID=2594478 RepID=UPI002490BF86|nr:cellulase family glycosylhydrolase [Maribacter luteus]